MGRYVPDKRFELTRSRVAPARAAAFAAQERGSVAEQRRQKVDPFRRARVVRASSVPLVILTCLSTLVVGAVAAAFFVVPLTLLFMLSASDPASTLRFGLGVILAIGVASALLSAPVLVRTLRNADRMIAQATGARPAQSDREKRVRDVVEEMCVAAGLATMPEVMVLDSEFPNSMVSGLIGGSATVVVTTGLLEILDRQELQAAVAHEVAHIAGHDIRTKTHLAAILLRFEWVRDAIRGVRSDFSNESGLGYWFILPVGFATVIVQLPREDRRTERLQTARVRRR